jgi:hypothetical protein
MKKLGKEDYIEHLNRINRNLILFYELVLKGNKDLIQDLALKIRILYMKKSGTEPLLKTIQNLFGFKFKVWVRESPKEELRRKGLEHLIESMSFSYFNEIMFWLESGNQKAEIIEAFHRSDSLNIGKFSYSAKELIELVADKLGGAHIDPKLNEKALIPQSNQINFEGYNMYEYFILKTTKQTIEINKVILEYISQGKQSEFIEIN